MTIEQARKLYLEIVEDSSESDFGEEDWKEIRDELLAVVSANSVADATIILKQKEYGKPEQCAIGFRNEWGRMNGISYVATDRLMAFIRESNGIAGIEREPTREEIEEMKGFLALPEITVKELLRFIAIYEPSAMLREREELSLLLRVPKLSAYDRHVRYETLRPFTDCNGRSGRALWLWDMKGKAPLGFLNTWYYQSLEASRK